MTEIGLKNRKCANISVSMLHLLALSVYLVSFFFFFFFFSFLFFFLVWNLGSLRRRYIASLLTNYEQKQAGS